LKSGEPALLLMSHRAVRADRLELAGRIAGKTGCTVMAATFSPRVERGQGRFGIERLHFVLDTAVAMLKDFRHIILVEADEPVAFFAYPDKPSLLRPKGCSVHRLCDIGGGSLGALQALADAVGARASDLKPQSHAELSRPTGAITHASIAQAIAVTIPENAIVVDEAITTGRAFFAPTSGAKPHDWLQNLGGSIGFGPPVATGAAIACPDRRVIALEGDGSAMYTVQALWTQARESLDITTVIFANRSYQILKGEFAGVGAGAPGAKAEDMLSIDRPTIDWVALSNSMGVPAVRVSRAEDLCKALDNANTAAGPGLIEVQM
jgi:acetolactate synthase-1/2/3 large subunit